MDDIFLCDSKNIITEDLGNQTFIIYKYQHISYLLCFQKIHQAPKSIIINDGQSIFMCGFLKFINLQYLNSLNKLLQQICLQPTILLKQWLCLYQISSFIPKSFKRYKIQYPSYGKDVKIYFKQSCHNTKISNYFSLDGLNFYFLQQTNQNNLKSQIGLVYSFFDKQVIGISFNYQSGPQIFIPFCLIISELSPPLRITEQMQAILQKTVYLQIDGSYSTGTFISQRRILTVRHLLNIKNPKIGLIVNMKKYPYIKTHSARLAKLFFDQIDLIQLEFETKHDQKSSLHDKKLQPSYYIEQKESSSSIFIGQPIVALGFGKYNYSFSKFSEIDILLPTISSGIISKNIFINNQKIFFKTDASLYNGFSGCGIWSENHQIGVAVFIITNTSTNSKLQKQNFSYYLQFVLNRLIKSSNTLLTKNQLQLIKNIDRFGVRIQMKVLPSL